jgi:hypothetical protein
MHVDCWRREAERKMREPAGCQTNDRESSLSQLPGRLRFAALPMPPHVGPGSLQKGTHGASDVNFALTLGEPNRLATYIDSEVDEPPHEPNTYLCTKCLRRRRWRRRAEMHAAPWSKRIHRLCGVRCRWVTPLPRRRCPFPEVQSVFALSFLGSGWALEPPT